MNSLQASKSLSNGLEFTVQSFMRAPLKTALVSWAPSINIIIIIIIITIIIIICSPYPFALLSYRQLQWSVIYNIQDGFAHLLAVFCNFSNSWPYKTSSHSVILLQIYNERSKQYRDMQTCLMSTEAQQR